MGPLICECRTRMDELTVDIGNPTTFLVTQGIISTPEVHRESAPRTRRPYFGQVTWSASNLITTR